MRLGEPELVEEAGHRGLGMRVIKDKRVALTSTSDLTPRGLDRFVADALELVELSQEDPFAGPADPELLAEGALPDLDLYDPAGGEVTRGRGDRARPARRGRRRATSTRASPTATAPPSRAPRAPSRSCSRAASAAATPARTRRWSSAPSPTTRAARSAAATTGPPSATSRELDAPEDVGREAARRTLRKLGARKVPTCEAPVVFDPDAARVHPRPAGGLRHGQLHLAQVELPRRPRGDARRERSRDHRRRSAHPARARLAPLRRRGPPRAAQRRRREGHRSGRTSATATPRASSAAPDRPARRAAAAAASGPPRRTSSSSPAPTQRRRHRAGDAARPLRDRDDGLRLQRRDRRLLARRLRLLDRGRRARVPGERGDHLAQRRRALAAHRRRRRRSRPAQRHRLAHAARVGDLGHMAREPAARRPLAHAVGPRFWYRIRGRRVWPLGLGHRSMGFLALVSAGCRQVLPSRRAPAPPAPPHRRRRPRRTPAARRSSPAHAASSGFQIAVRRSRRRGRGAAALLHLPAATPGGMPLVGAASRRGAVEPAHDMPAGKCAPRSMSLPAGDESASEPSSIDAEARSPDATDSGRSP